MSDAQQVASLGPVGLWVHCAGPVVEVAARSCSFEPPYEPFVTVRELRSGALWTYSFLEFTREVEHAGQRVPRFAPYERPAPPEPEKLKLAVRQNEQLRLLAKGPQDTYGRSRTRVQNALVGMGLARFYWNGQPVMPRDPNDECRITPAGEAWIAAHPIRRRTGEG